MKTTRRWCALPTPSVAPNSGATNASKRSPSSANAKRIAATTKRRLRVATPSSPNVCVRTIPSVAKAAGIRSASNARAINATPPVVASPCVATDCVSRPKPAPTVETIAVSARAIVAKPTEAPAARTPLWRRACATALAWTNAAPTNGAPSAVSKRKSSAGSVPAATGYAARKSPAPPARPTAASARATAPPLSHRPDATTPTSKSAPASSGLAVAPTNGTDCVWKRPRNAGPAATHAKTDAPMPAMT